MRALTCFRYWLRPREDADRIVQAAVAGEDDEALRLFAAWLIEGGLGTALAARTGQKTQPEVTREEVANAIRILDQIGVRSPHIRAAKVGDIARDPESNGERRLIWTLRDCGNWRGFRAVLEGPTFAAAKTLVRYGRMQPAKADEPVLVTATGEPWTLRQIRYAASGRPEGR